LTVSQFDQSLASSLLAAQQWLDDGRVDAVLLGVVDEYCSVLGYCWERFFGCCKDAKMQPFDSSRNSAIAGEGAAFFLLQEDSPGWPCYARIDRVDMGHLGGKSLQFCVDQPLILSCEGIAATVNYYRQQLTEKTKVACYSPLYGASPVTHAFDLAVGGLALQHGGLFPSAAIGGDIGESVVTTELPCQSLSCLRLGSDGEYGAIHLKKGRC
jgi:3-oxoacyl-[acyl-carrier-protein] synthase II